MVIRHNDHLPWACSGTRASYAEGEPPSGGATQQQHEDGPAQGDHADGTTERTTPAADDAGASEAGTWTGSPESGGTPLLRGLTVAAVVVLVGFGFMATRKPHDVPMREAVA